jgi:hypothetical protein
MHVHVYNSEHIYLQHETDCILAANGGVLGIQANDKTVRWVSLYKRSCIQSEKEFAYKV